MNKYEILIAGVGGQGVVSLGIILGHAAKLNGFSNVVGGEVHGLSQRGGSVVSYVRFGTGVYGPIIPLGTGDMIIGLEFMEGIRHISRLSRRGVLVLSDTKMPSMGMMIRGIAYPEPKEMLSKLKENSFNPLMFETGNMAKNLGHSTLTNVLLLGAIVNNIHEFPIDRESIRKSIVSVFRNDMAEQNLAALAEGMKLKPTLL